MTAARSVLAVGLLMLACRPGEAPRATTPIPGLPRREPGVRIGITVDSSAAVVGAQTSFEIRASDRVLATSPASESWTVTAEGDARLRATSSAGRTIEPMPGPLRVVAERGGPVLIGQRPYRGEAVLTARAGGRVTAVNVVELEAYLLGVVPREIGRRPAAEIEAIKAQAVAARTYAIGNLGGRAALGFDFYATVQDQVYGGVTDEDTIVSRAVRDTYGEIVTYQGSPILAYYSSTCGGQTSAIEHSWPWRAPLPYLKSVSDRIPGSNDAYCSTSSRYRWTTSWTREQLLSVLAQTLQAHTTATGSAVSQVQNVELVQTNASGRATVRLRANGRAYTLRNDSIRWVLRPQPGPALLNSSRLYDVRVEVASDEVHNLAIEGGGWGHGIGLCQVGAMGRARAGQNYRQILTTYYTGTEVSRLY